MDPGQILRWLGGKVDVRVRIATGLSSEDAAVWDTALWDAAVWSSEDLAYQDISEWVEEVNYRRGTERWDSRFTAGTATVILDNTTGMFTPISDAPQPWGVPFRPGRKVQVSILPDPTTDTRVVLFTGRIDDRVDTYGDAGANLTTQIELLDILGELGVNNPPALETATGVQSTDERVHAALDYAGVPLDIRDIDAGVHTMTTSFLAQSTLEEAQRAADAEGGAFFADPEGRLVFRSRDWLTASPRSTTVQGYVGLETPPPGEPSAQIESGSVRTTESLGRVRNDIQYARDGGVLQHEEDPDSITLHGRRSYSRTDLNNNADSEVGFLAARALAAYAEGRLRVEEVAIVANDDPDNEDLNRLFYAVEMGDLIALEVRTLHGWRIPSATTHVIGIAGRITPEDWRVVFTLDDSLAAPEVF
jgi:hypothetical protein